MHERDVGMKRNLWIAAVALIVIVALSAFILYQQRSLASQEEELNRVKAYQDAENRHELNAIMAMFSDEAVLTIEGQFTKVGKEQVRAFQVYEGTIHAQFRFVDCKAEGNMVACKAVESNDLLTDQGFAQRYYDSFVFTFRDGLILQVVATSPTIHMCL